MPNKTIYVSDADLELFRRAQELAGGNLSAAITRALRRSIAAEEGALEGLQEITVRVGPGRTRTQRFMGVLLAETGRSTSDSTEHVRVYRTRHGRFAVHTEHSAQHTWTAGPDGTATGWRKHVSSDQQWTTTPPSATLEVVDDLEQLAAVVPPPLFDLVAAAVEPPVVEDLDI